MDDQQQTARESRPASLSDDHDQSECVRRLSNEFQRVGEDRAVRILGAYFRAIRINRLRLSRGFANGGMESARTPQAKKKSG